MRRIEFLLLPALAAFALSGCNKSGAVSATAVVSSSPDQQKKSAIAAPGQEMSYLPIKQGNTWVFTSTTQQVIGGRAIAPQTKVVEYKIEKVSPIKGGGNYCLFEIKEGDKVTDRQVWRVDKNGIFQEALGVKPTRFTSPQPVLKFPVKIGSKFSWKGSVTLNGDKRSGTTNATVLEPETVDSEKGEYNALPIESSGTMSSKLSENQVFSKVWLAPGSGIVRYYQEAVGRVKDKNKTMFVLKQTLTLKSTTIAP